MKVLKATELEIRDFIEIGIANAIIYKRDGARLRRAQKSRAQIFRNLRKRYDDALRLQNAPHTVIKSGSQRTLRVIAKNYVWDKRLQIR